MDNSLQIRFDVQRQEFVVLVLEGRRAMQRNVVRRKTGRGVVIEDFFTNNGINVDEITSAVVGTEPIPGIELPRPPGKNKQKYDPAVAIGA